MLIVVTLLPLAGVAVIALLHGLRVNPTWHSRVALACNGVNLGLTLFLFLTQSREGGMQWNQELQWLNDPAVSLHLGVDELSLSLILLANFIAVVATFASLRHHDRPASYFALLLLLQCGILGTFCALDAFLFYIFWELMLVPMYFLIGLWGGARREYAAMKFFLYTLVGSVALLIAFIGLYQASGDFNLLHWIQIAHNGALRLQPDFLGLPFNKTIFVLLFVGFAIKIPVVPLHTWLADAHIEASTPVSVILAAVLLKTGAYGLLRFNLPLFPELVSWFSCALGALGVVSMLYGAFLALAQNDAKRLVAFSSISHMGFVLLGLASATSLGIAGAAFQLWGHGVTAALLFLLVGVVYERTHTRKLDSLGGLAALMPEFALLAAVAFFSASALPGLVGFVGEFLILLGAWNAPDSQSNSFRWLVLCGVPTMVLAAAYCLNALRRILLGAPMPRLQGDKGPQLLGHERAALYPLVFLCVALGLHPAPLLQPLSVWAHKLLAQIFGNV